MGATLKPNKFLQNVSIAHFQADELYVARKVFPIVQVDLQSSYYLKFNKGDLARDDMRDKPKFGKVQPALMGQTEDTYFCREKQFILGIDQIGANNTKRMGVPGIQDAYAAKARIAAEKVNIHLDTMFADNYFKAGVWSNELTGVTTTPGSNQFIQFDNANSDPVALINKLKRDMQRNGRRMPNKLTLGAAVYDALLEHPGIVERIKYSGSTANPAIVNEKVLAQLFGVEDVLVLQSTYNAALPGEEDNMQYIGDEKSVLLSYAPNAATIDTPSAGYIFMWDMGLGGSMYYVANWEGEEGTHTEYVEAMVSADMKVTGDDMGAFLTNVVA